MTNREGDKGGKPSAEETTGKIRLRREPAAERTLVGEPVTEHTMVTREHTGLLRRFAEAGFEIEPETLDAMLHEAEAYLPDGSLNQSKIDALINDLKNLKEYVEKAGLGRLFAPRWTEKLDGTNTGFDTLEQADDWLNARNFYTGSPVGYLVTTTSEIEIMIAGSVTRVSITYRLDTKHPNHMVVRHPIGMQRIV